MARKGLSAILALLVASISLSGCIGQEGAETASLQSEKDGLENQLPYTEDGIRDSSTSRGLGDVYKRQAEIVVLTF